MKFIYSAIDLSIYLPLTHTMLATHWPSTSDKDRTWDYPYSRLHWTRRSFISERVYHPLFSPHQCANPVFGFAFFTLSSFPRQTQRTFSGSIGRNCKYFVFIYQCSSFLLMLLSRVLTWLNDFVLYIYYLPTHL